MKKQSKKHSDLNINLPMKWGELTSEQIMRVSYFLAQGMTETEYLVLLGVEFAGLIPHGSSVMENGDIGYVYYDRKVGNIVLSAEQVAQIATSMSWITGDPEPMQAPVLDGYSTPDRDIYGVCLEQLLTADVACTHYLTAKEPAALRMMVAALYLRKEFNPDTLQLEADRLSYKPIWELESVVLWFVGVKKMLKAKYPNVYAGSGSDNNTQPGEDIMLGILSALNGGDISKNTVIKRTDAHEALYELEQKIKAANKKK